MEILEGWFRCCTCADLLSDGYLAQDAQGAPMRFGPNAGGEERGVCVSCYRKHQAEGVTDGVDAIAAATEAMSHETTEGQAP